MANDPFKQECQTSCEFLGRASWDLFVSLLIIDMCTKFHPAKWNSIQGLNSSFFLIERTPENFPNFPKMAILNQNSQFIVCF